MFTLDEKAEIFLTTARDLAQFTADEAELLGFDVVECSQAGVRLMGTLADAMYLNLHLRTAHRVFFALEEMYIQDVEDLYSHIKKMPWEDLIAKDGYISVSSSVVNESVADPRFVNVRIKDAIVDRFTEKFAQRPDSGRETSGVCLFCYWREDKITLYLDTTGKPLSYRGYRKHPHKAPLQETLAAACILSTSWRGREQDGPFVAPMCGSGTFAIEAALIATNTAAGSLREEFSFQHILPYSEKYKSIFEGYKKEAQEKVIPLQVSIIANDSDERAVFATQENCKLANMSDIFIERCDFTKTPLPKDEGIIMMNPEYGERLGSEKNLELMYKDIGDFLKKDCAGYKAYILAGNSTLVKQIGLRTSKRIIFHNAKIECRLLEYILFRGRLKEQV